MASRIEIAKMYNGKIELRIGDLTGASTSRKNFSGETIMTLQHAKAGGIKD